jgi:uncharacterized membrane protein
VTETARKASKALSVGNKIAPWRFLLFLAVMVGGYFAYRAVWPMGKWSDAAAMAFDFAAVVFLATLLPLLSDNSAEIIRDHAARNDANRGVILIFTSLLTIVAMTAISGELQGARHGELVSMVKLVGTLFLIWLFANSIYALHYAHSYYTSSEETGADRAGIEFPGTEMPGYGDFVYFAYTLGMTFQTSDTNITAPGIRHVALFHSFFSFLFSIGVIAFTINVLGGGGG